MFQLLFSFLLLSFGHAEPIKINLITTNDIHGVIGKQKANFMNPQYPPTILGGAAFSRYVDELRIEAKKKSEGLLPNISKPKIYW